MVRKNIENKMEMADAINKAVNEAIRLNLLNGFFKVHKSEVLNMCMTEFDQEKYDYSRYMEGYDDGVEQGIEKTRKEYNVIVAEKDNELAEQANLIARLQEEIRLLKSC